MSAQDTTEVRPVVTVLPDGPITKPAEVPPKQEEVKEPETKEEVAAESTEVKEGQERDETGRFKPNRVQERIDELTRKAGESAREAAYYRGLHEAAQAKAEPTAKAEDPTKPKPEQFQTYDEFTEALTDWKIEQREQSRTQKEQAQAAASTWNERATTARQTMPDFDAVLSNSTAPMTQAMAETIKDSESGPALAYHLAKNPAEAARIAGLSPFAAARELGKLEATLSAPKAAAPAAPAARVTHAPTPPTPVGSGRSTEGDPGKMPMADYLVWRETQLKERR